jgi:hypothetical protein
MDPMMVSLLSQLNAVHILILYHLKLNFSVILPYKPSLKWSFLFRLLQAGPD